MKKRIMAIAAAVILVAAFVFMAVPAGAEAAIYDDSFINILSHTSLLNDGVYHGSFGGTDSSFSLINGARLYGNSGTVTSDQGVFGWILVENKGNFLYDFDAKLTFNNTDHTIRPYPKVEFGLTERNFVSVNGVSYDLYGYLFEVDEWHDMFGAGVAPNVASCSLSRALGDGGNFLYYAGINRVSDFYSAIYNAGAASQLGDFYRGIYAGAEWSLRLNLNTSYEGMMYWETDITPVARDGYIDVNAAYSDAVQRFYAETGLPGLAIESVLVTCDFYYPYELSMGAILTSGLVDSSVSLNLFTANGNKYRLRAIDDGDGWIKWDNENVSRIEKFSSFHYLVPVALIRDYLRFYTAGAEWDAGYNAGYDAGFSNGEIVGSESGFSAGYDKGESEGYLVGFGDGYIDGAADGRDEGYRKGYSAGLQVSENAEFQDLIFAVVDTPVQAFLGLLTFDVLGVNIANFLLSLISAFFALKILKMIFAF